VTGWLRDGRPLTARRRDHLIITGGLLTINSFSRHGSEKAPADEGSYQCVAAGQHGALVSRPARLVTAGMNIYIK